MPAIVAPTLSDGRIGVRAIAPGDIPDIVAACRDPEIPRWTRVPSPYTREDAEQFLAVAAAEARAGAGVALAVCDAASDRLIGTVGLMEVDRERGYGEIGYWTAAPARGRGAASGAVALLRDWAHSELGLSEIEILSHRDNRPSQRVAERAGFVDTGERPRGAAHAAGQARRATASSPGGRPEVRRGKAVPGGPPLLILLLPVAARAVRAARARGGSCWRRPARWRSSPRGSRIGALGVLPPALGFFVARRQAKRMRLPGVPAAIAVFHAHQVPLAVALTERHLGAELWQLGADPTDGLDSAFVLDLGAATDLRGVWKRIEALGIESGRLGSEREL